MTRLEYMKAFGLSGFPERPNDPPDERFMNAVEKLAEQFDHILNDAQEDINDV